MKFVDYQREKGAFIQRVGHQPDHCVVHPDDVKELLETAGIHARTVQQKIEGKKVTTHAMVDGVPVLPLASQPVGTPLFELRDRLPYEAPPAFMKPRKPRAR